MIHHSGVSHKKSDKLFVRHIELKEANHFIEQNHRHHGKVSGHRFSLGCFYNGELVGIAVVARPIARNIDATTTVEVTRLCTNGTRNACSKLYGACRRAAKALGYERIITYILDSEDGASLSASGWQFVYMTRGDTWNRKSRIRVDKHPLCKKKLFHCIL